MAGRAVRRLVAFYAWRLIEPGWRAAVLFNVMLIAGVSTLISRQSSAAATTPITSWRT